jgi:ABC-2 type transport system permease protein
MTSTTATTTTHDRTAGGTAPAAGLVTLPHVFRSELIKLRSVRSTAWTLLVAALSIVGFGVVGAWSVLLHTRVPDPPLLDPTGGALSGVSPAMFAVAVLGLLSVTGEYATGTIKTSLTAVPRRSMLLLGKALALACLTLPVVLLSTVVAFFSAKVLLGANDVAVSLGSPGVLRAVVGAALSTAVLAVLAAGFGWVFRRTAGAMAVLFAVMVLLPLPVMLLPGPIAAAVGPYLPGSVATALSQVVGDPALPPWAAFGVFVGYAVVMLAAGALTLRRRDA